MKTRKRIILWSIFAVLFVYNTWNGAGTFIADINYHNSNHAPFFKGKMMKEANGSFVYKDSISNLCYFVSNEFIQKECNCRICREKESFIIRAATALNIIKEAKPVVKYRGLYFPGFGVTMASN